MAEAAAARDGKRDLAEQFQARARAADGDPPPVADLKAQIRAYREIPAGYDHDPTPACAPGFGGLPGSRASGSLMRCPSLGRLISRRTDASLHVIRHGFGISISLPCASARSTLWWAVTTSSSGRRAAITGL